MNSVLRAIAVVGVVVCGQAVGQIVVSTEPGDVLVAQTLPDSVAAEAPGQADGPGEQVTGYPAKPAHTVLDQRFRNDVIVVKFRDGLHVRLRGGELRDLDTGVPGEAQTQAVLARAASGTWERLHDLPEDKLDELHQVAEQELGRSVADLNLYFRLSLPPGEDASATIDALNSLDIVELAQGAPIPVPAPFPPPNYDPNEGYLNAAPVGIGARSVWPMSGGTGANVRLADLEYSWNRQHGDFPVVTLLNPGPPYPVDPFNDPNHGTAVLGEIFALTNGWGVTGASYGATAYVVATNTTAGYSIENAITTALGTLQAGDIILIEQQIGGPLYDPNNVDPNNPQRGLVAVDWYKPIYDAVVTAVGNGRIVVEAAGNGEQNLDNSIYRWGPNDPRPFSAGYRSGSLIIGAGAVPAAFGGTQTDRSRLWFSNYGSAVDLQGWGEHVYTTGYGNAYSGDGVNYWYTGTFGGTSSASPNVAAAAALVESVSKAASGKTLSAALVRNLLIQTGSPQQGGPYSGNIGPRTNVVAALATNGACCYGDGTCSVTTLPSCTGTWQGMGTTCSPNPCPQPGACCVAATGACYMSTVTAPGSCGGDTYWGNNTTCTPNPCPQPQGLCYDGTDVGGGFTWTTHTDPNTWDPNDPNDRAPLPIRGNLVYCNEGLSGYYIAGGAAPDEILLDDIELAGVDREICEITAIVYAGQISLVPYDVTLTIWAACPSPDGPFDMSNPLCLASATEIMRRTRGPLTFVFDPPILVPDNYVPDPNDPCAPPYGAVDFWIGFQHNKPSGSGIGLLICEYPTQPELGNSDDRFGDELQCNRNFEGLLPGNFPWRIYATSRIGACCDRSTGVCTDNVLSRDCSGFYKDHYPEQICYERDVVCTVSTGACCDLQTMPGSCTDNVQELTCLGPTGNNGNKFARNVLCSSNPFTPWCGTGACCDTMTLTCVDNQTQAQCSGSYKLWKWNETCAQQIGCHAVPANDLCQNAITLTGTCITTAFYTDNATYTAYLDDPPECLRNADPNLDVPITNDIWYFYRIPSTHNGSVVDNGKVLISTLGSYFDTALAVYGKPNDVACGQSGAVTCADVSNANLVYNGCNDDIVPRASGEYDPDHGQVQASFVSVDADGVNGPLPGGCLLIRVGGLEEPGNPAGGTGQLNIDFIPISPDPFYSNEGICCLLTGECIVTAGAADCAGAQIGYFREFTDFYEGGNPNPPFEAKAPGCCHSDGLGAGQLHDYGECVQGRYCGKAIQLNVIDANTLRWQGQVAYVTYFKFITRDFRPGDPGYGGWDARYGLTIDTCGSLFDTMLSLYKARDELGMLPFDDNGECLERDWQVPAVPPNYLIKRSDDCTIAEVGVEDKITDPNCIGWSVTTSCMCLTVGQGGMLEANREYYIGVGMRDNRTGTGFVPRYEGIDPVPNYPIDPAVALRVTVKENWPECLPCNRTCPCKGDFNDDFRVDGKDVQPFIAALMDSDLPCTDITWCEVNMNDDGALDFADVQLFVADLLFGYNCTPAPLDTDDVARCQSPDPVPPSGNPAPRYGCSAAAGNPSDAGCGVFLMDNFSSPTGGLLSALSWWGYYADPNQTMPSGPKANDWRITYYRDSSGQPGAIKYGPFFVGSDPNDFAWTLVGNLEIGNGVSVPYYLFEAWHTPMIMAPNECLWIEIVNMATTPADCCFFWETAAPGDGKSWDDSNGIIDRDMAFCVNVPIYRNGCGNVTCYVTYPNTEGEASCVTPGWMNANPGCFGWNRQGPMTPVLIAGPGTYVISGTTGAYTTTTLPCDANNPCPTGSTCVSGFCGGGPFRLKDTDWYNLDLGTNSLRIRPTIKTELPIKVALFPDTPVDGSCDYYETLSPYVFAPTCTSGACGPLTLGSPETVFTGRVWLYVVPDGYSRDCPNDYEIDLQFNP